MKIRTALLILSLLLLSDCSLVGLEKLVFPHSQWTIGTSGHNIDWRYLEGFDYNSSFISAPDKGQWEVV